MTKSELCTYLKEVAGLEQDLYTLNETKSALQAQQRTAVPHSISEPEKPVLEPIQQSKYETETFGHSLCGFIGAVLTIAFSISEFQWWTLLLGPILAVIGWYICSGLYNISRKIQLKAVKMAEYKEAMSRYNKAMIRHEQNIKDEARRFANETDEVNRFNAKLSEQIGAIDTHFISTENALKKLYSLDVIFPKYRTIIPVTMFCEYLESGRCEDLAGANGAYNKYEEELRLDLIIGSIKDVNSILHCVSDQLGRISNQLNRFSEQAEKMRQNQYLLYQSMQESNRQIENISRSAATLAQNNAAIAKNTAWAAYSAASAARSANALAHVAEFEHNQRYITI